ncbi:MAG: plastocyanin/azurin family copper-binding protein [Planctomycetota bacterium]
MKPLLTIAAALAAASIASAQTTHTVSNGPGFEFAPADLTIQVGDTVQWVWQGTFFHNVESGVGSVPDGIFTSGSPVQGPATFSVTFDQAFLNANPVPGNAYDYYCIVHESLFGQTGVVRVTTDYGCQNPVGSLVDLSGGPEIGGLWVLGVDNPVPGGQTPGSAAFVAVSSQPAPGFPCGLPLPGFHMDPLLPFGELLVGIGGPDPLLIAGPGAWFGPGSPANVSIPLPFDPGLVGFELFTQGLLLDAVGTNTFGASNGLRATVGVAP